MATRRRFRVRLVTNAVSITDAMARALQKAGLKLAQVSLDGACEATHDKVRGKGNWARSMRGSSVSIVRLELGTINPT